MSQITLSSAEVISRITKCLDFRRAELQAELDELVDKLIAKPKWFGPKFTKETAAEYIIEHDGVFRRPFDEYKISCRIFTRQERDAEGVIAAAKLTESIIITHEHFHLLVD